MKYRIELDPSEDLAQDLADRDYWQSLAPPNWNLHGFTFRNAVSFRTNPVAVVGLYANFEYGQVSFIKDVINQYETKIQKLLDTLTYEDACGVRYSVHWGDEPLDEIIQGVLK